MFTFKFWPIGFLMPILVATLTGYSGLASGADFRIESFTLDNGMQFVVVPNPTTPVITHMVWYKAGSADDPPGKSGLAHLLEHLTIKSKRVYSDYRPGQLVAYTARHASANTSYDYTLYYDVTTADRLEAVMGLAARAMAKLPITSQDVQEAKEEVRQERRHGLVDDSEALLDQRISASLYAGQSYGNPILGWSNETGAIAQEDVLAFFRRWYAPNNAIVTVTGNITAAQLKPLAQKYYGVLPVRTTDRRHSAQESARRAKGQVIMQDVQSVYPIWKRAYLAPSYTTGETKHAYALQVLAEILGGATASRLEQRIVKGKQLATEVFVDYLPDTRGLARFDLLAVPSPGVGIDELERAIDQEIDAVIVNGVSSEEVLRAQQSMRADIASMWQDPYSAAEFVGVSVATGQKVRDVEAWGHRISAVTPEEVHQAANAVFRSSPSVTGVLSRNVIE